MEDRKNFKAEAYAIGIVGLGPKGLYGLERLLAQLRDLKINCPIHIHVYNQNKFFGAGDIYRCDQPSYLIMNYSNRNIDMWSNEKPLGILEKTHDFTTWLSLKRVIPKAQLENGFSSRAMVGNYLMDGFNRLSQNLPQNIKIFPHISTVVDIVKIKDNYVIKSIENEINIQRNLQKILITTGHSWNGAKFETAHDSNPYIDFIYPTDKKLGTIPKGVTVAIKGMGLTFIDAVLALTEGLGGRFKMTPDGDYHYIPSGNEPSKLIPFSRSGIPMIPRNGEADDSNSTYYFTEEILKRKNIRTPICFVDHILPLIKKEFCFNYYKVLFKNNKLELLYDANFKNVEKQIDEYHNQFPKEARYTWEMIENPFCEVKPLTQKELIEYMIMGIQEAEKSSLLSPLISAIGTWRKISAIFNKVYSFGGLDAVSHKLFDSHYFGFFNRIAYGPPIENMKKVLALTKCGLLDFNFARNPKITHLQDSFIISSQEEQKSIVVDYLVDARIPRGGSKVKISRLFSNLLKRGTLWYYCNEDDIKYTPGCIDVDYKGRPLDIAGNVNKDITFYGTPTEGITFDNDTLSRKRNNFASQWAYDVALEIQCTPENLIKDNSKNGILQR